MTTPHEHYDEFDNPEIESYGNNALYEEQDAYANGYKSSVPLNSTFGRGPRGDAYIPEITKNTDDDFEFKLKNDRLPDQHISSPNLHAGKISVEVDPLPSNTDVNDEGREHLIWPSSDTEGQHVHFFISRGGVKKEIANAVLPKGNHGSYIFSIDYHNVKELSTDMAMEYLKSDLLYNGEQLPEAPEPRIWDVVLANVYAFAPDVEPPVKRQYFASGIIVAVTSTTVTVLFKTLYRDSELDDKEDKANKVTSVDESSTDIQYPSAKCLYNVQQMLKQLIQDEEDRAKEAEEELQENIDAEEERAKGVEEDLQDQIINDVTRIIMCDSLPPISQAKVNYIYSIPKNAEDVSDRNTRYEFYKAGNQWEQIGKDLPKHGIEIHLPTGEVLWYDPSDGKMYMLLDWETGQEKELTFESTKEDPAITADSFIVSATEGFDVRITE